MYIYTQAGDDAPITKRGRMTLWILNTVLLLAILVGIVILLFAK